MKLDVECTWNEGQNKAKQTIHFKCLPKNIFGMPEEEIRLLQNFAGQIPEKGPPLLSELEGFIEKYPKSLYAHMINYRALEFFEFTDDAEELFETMKKRFPGQVFVKCIEASCLLKDREVFKAVFNGIEVLKGAFPKRKAFYFEEALFFHQLWAHFFDHEGDGIQSDKHKRFVFLIMQTLQTFQLAR